MMTTTATEDTVAAVVVQEAHLAEAGEVHPVAAVLSKAFQGAEVLALCHVKK
jgi:hypothetical protein